MSINVFHLMNQVVKSKLVWRNNEWYNTDVPIPFYLISISNQIPFNLIDLNITVRDNENGRIEHVQKNHLFEWYLSTKEDINAYANYEDYQQKIKEMFGESTQITSMICLIITAIDFIPSEYCEGDMGEDNIIDLYIYFGYYRDNTNNIKYEIKYDLDGFKEFELINLTIDIEWQAKFEVITEINQLITSGKYLN